VQKVKEQLAARLDAPKEASVTVDNIKWVKQEIDYKINILMPQIGVW
jgi:hypothetical protein